MGLLAPGGVCVNIDMNNRFPFFRSALKNALRRPSEEECYLPSLEAYAATFEETGFELLRKEHFCWIPHTGGFSPSLWTFSHSIRSGVALRVTLRIIRPKPFHISINI